MTSPTVFASGLRKHLYFLKESTWGTLASNSSSAFELYRIQSSLSLNKASFQSNRINPSQQVQFVAHGIRSVSGTVSGEATPKDWSQLIASTLRGSFASGNTKSHTDFGGTLAATASTATMVCSASDFVTQGFMLGDAFTLSGTSSSKNCNQTFRILGFSHTTNPNDTITVDPAPIDMSADSGFTMTVTGKKVVTGIAPSTDDSYSFEHWHSDINQSERFVGCKPSGFQFTLPASGYCNLSVNFMGRDRQKGTSQYYSDAPSHTDYGLCPSMASTVSVNGVNIPYLTGLNFSVQPQLQQAPAVGQTLLTGIFEGTMSVTGSFTAYFPDETIDTFFDTEEVVPIDIMLPTVSGTGVPNFIKFTLPTCKLMSDANNDGSAALIKSFNFTAYLDQNATTNDLATLIYQDSNA